MDPFSRHYFNLNFRIRFVEARGDEFQRFFGQLMNLRYPGDFTQTKPWGRLGDDKCDGFLPSQRKLYQCYGPDDLTQRATLDKIREDFEGSLPLAGEHFNTWVFVHNSRDGRIPSWLTVALDKLRHRHPEVNIETMGYLELLQEAMNLDEKNLIILFGAFPSLKDFLSISFEALKPLLQHVACQSPPIDTPPMTVPPQKMEHNQLSEDVQALLRLGISKARVVRDFLDGYPDKELAARVAGAFRSKYVQLREEGSEPDQIFHSLRVFTQGTFTQEPRHEVAVFAVLAYLFEECDIFERPPEV